MKKKLAILGLVTLLTLLTTMPALAGQGPGQGGAVGDDPFSFVGTITAVGSDTITVQVLNNRFAGQVLTVQLTKSTDYFEWTAAGLIPSTFGAVAVGDSANVKGTMADGVYVAVQVIVDVPLYCFE
ncbi:MAG: DUF5666 domain-containing protein [Anaerolineales bacterium]|nr:DUF5666 domain-containing protein [Anaerolineales bacterium]